MRQLGDILLDRGLVTKGQLQVAFSEHERVGRPLGRVLVDSGVLTETQLVAALAEQIGMRFVEVEQVQLDRHALDLVPLTLCRRYTAVPLGLEEGRLVVAMADPANVFALDEIRRVAGVELRPVVTTRLGVLGALDRLERFQTLEQEAEANALVGDLDDGAGLADRPPGLRTSSYRATLGPLDLGDTGDLTGALSIADRLARLEADLFRGPDDPPVVKYVSLLVGQAYDDGAEAIHLDPEEHDLRVRFRIDGVLSDVMRSPRVVGPGVVARFKIMAGLDITDRTRPQQARVSATLGGRAVDLDVLILPTVWGERVVLRLRRSPSALALAELGLTRSELIVVRDALAAPHGLVLSAGSVRSGRTTTRYALLGELDVAHRDTVSLEDPVVFSVPGVSQVKVDLDAGMGLTSLLSGVLGAEPDVVALPDLSDGFDAATAVKAAAGGKLVLAGVAAADAAQALQRVVDMGVEPYLLAASTRVVIAQRLLRALCTVCAEPEPWDPGAAPRAVAEQAQNRWAAAQASETNVRAPRGCSSCAYTGYRGRVPLFEVWPIAAQLSSAIRSGCDRDALTATAHTLGLTTLMDRGLAAVAAGTTSLAEVLRLLG